jgi:hypothetical protein
MIRVTQHALDRYRERIAPVSEEEARDAILAHITVINIALAFGAPCVRCGDGMRLLMKDGAITTVLAPEMRLGRVAA